MRFLKITVLSACAGVLFSTSLSLAQTPAPAAPAAPTDKGAVSKACSDQANAKGLHGKTRKTFRAQCKKAGGKPS